MSDEERAQAAAQQYFLQYQLQCAANPEGMRAELAHWEEGDATILDVGIEEQSAYADYVTRKICTEQPDEIIVTTSRQLLEPHAGVKLNSCAIGNMALLVKTIREMEGHDELKGQLNQAFEAMLEDQREIRRRIPQECSLQ